MLFDEQIARKPNNYPWTQEFIDRIWAGFWTPNEFDFKADYGQFKTELTDQERQIIVRTLSAIGQIEIAVKRFWAQLGTTFKHPSMSDLGYWMAATEVTHNLAYEKLLETLRLGDVFEENLKEPVVRNRVEYLRKYLGRVYTDDKKQFVYAIILFTLFVENVSLFSQFYVVLWFNRFRNVLKDTAQQVQYTRNEEMLHAQVGIKLIQTLRHEYPELFDQELEDRILQESKVAYEAEKALITWIVGEFNEGSLSAEILHGFIEKRFNESLTSIGFSAPFVIAQSTLDAIRWMDEESYGNNIVDFFHKRPVDYAKKNRAYTTKDLF